MYVKLDVVLAEAREFERGRNEVPFLVLVKVHSKQKV